MCSIKSIGASASTAEECVSGSEPCFAVNYCGLPVKKPVLKTVGHRTSPDQAFHCPANFEMCSRCPCTTITVFIFKIFLIDHIRHKKNSKRRRHTAIRFPLPQNVASI